MNLTIVLNSIYSYLVNLRPEYDRSSRIAFTIGNISVMWYAIIIMSGAIIGTLYGYYRFGKRLGLDSDTVLTGLALGLIFGIIGARLYYVLFNLSYYSHNVAEIFKIWNGGLAITGGTIAGLITILLYCKKYKVNSLKVLDIIVVALLLSQAIGRWGNFFNSEAYGISVEYKTLVNLKIIPQFIIDNMYINGAYHLPMFYFESLWCFLGFIISLIIRRMRYIKDGQILSFYLIWYGFARFFIEIFRTDSLMLGSIKIACVMSVIMFITGIIITVIQNKKPKLDNLYNTGLKEEIRF